ncbi:MAG: hypothetical protein OXF05_01435 [Hyphomicrobiales bacterium]|nr:hypothetical protein [Hyphomicrobiales bacterium]MCY4033785.1 hypothetical protein [Hyphomicrobiales bacterium]MCY4039420.1 hypothetical protein [Hyphomicrobiales bacterium]
MTDPANFNTSSAATTHATVTVKGSHFYVNGQEMSLGGVLATLLSQRVENLDNAVGGYVEEMAKQNEEAKQCNEWLATLRSLRPEKQDGKVNVNPCTQNSYTSERHLFQQKYGYYPEEKFGTLQFIHSKGNYSNTGMWSYAFTQTDMDQMLETVKSQQSTFSTNQSMVQLRLEKLSHALSEVQQLSAALEKELYDTSQQVISKT